MPGNRETKSAQLCEGRLVSCPQSSTHALHTFLLSAIRNWMLFSHKRSQKVGGITRNLPIQAHHQLSGGSIIFGLIAQAFEQV